MTTDQLSALLANNKPAALAAAAAAVTGLVLYRRKRSAAPAGATAGAGIPGTSPAAAIVSPTAGMPTYDSSSFDAYNALQPEIDQILAQQQHATAGSGTGTTTAPTPVASTLLTPTYNGHYVQLPGGMVNEVESDGSMLWLTPSEHQTAFANSGGNWATSGLVDVLNSAPSGLKTYSVGDNLAALNKAPTS